MASTDAESPEDRQRWLLEQYTEIASLAGGLAHEIKNPLSTVTLNLQLLAEDFGQPETQKERRALQRIELLERECRRLEVILDDFLRFARVGDLHLAPTEIDGVVREMIDFFVPQAEADGVLIRQDLAAPNLRVPLDRDLFKQALLNLFLNAVQAMPKGGELILRTRPDGNFVLLEITDTGSGIQPDHVARIFKPFFSTRKGGSGLGLPTTKKIVEAHGGTLQLQTTAGKGTSFTIRIPMRALESPQSDV